MIEIYKGLGQRSSYLLDENGKNYRDINRAISNISKPVIDPVAILGILMKNYPIGNRSLVESISTAPWMAELSSNNSWSLSELPKHDNIMMSEKDIAPLFVDKLKKEALNFLKNKKRIGILLSGGMDSRIVAGIIHTLKIQGEYEGLVTAISWGQPNSRDTVYAQKIAKSFGWDFHLLPITSETLYENILLAGQLGAEFSPVHLHAMKAVSQIEGLDGILAGSYGDSIGRGEYSGRKVKNLHNIIDSHHNHFALMLNSAEKKSFIELKSDLHKSRARFSDRTESAHREIEMQQHYMRRQLNSCMNVIDNDIPLYQMFTSHEVFGFIWSLDYSCRTDSIYEEVLKILPGKLLDIPWARTGRKYNCTKTSSPKDELPSGYHRYGDWLRNDCRAFVLDNIQNGMLQSLGVFNEKSLDSLCKNWGKGRYPKADRLDEKLAWLASLSIFVKQYGIIGVDEFDYSVMDPIREKKALLYTHAYTSFLSVMGRR
ncbi:asparagine synthase-related protein [Vibrio kanaloae]|uniref:asparagine synthase-related protein n=1 Tax=Vibrio kanaloae TaxID=170673 RepID=UPI0011B39FF4|nr:asparagine synthase-related protein [Vibrio kanaloae]